MDDKTKIQEHAIKDIILKYGEVINLKTSPYLIGEIIRNYSSHFSGDSVSSAGPGGSQGPGGTNPPAGSNEIVNWQLMLVSMQKEVSGISKSLQELHTKVSSLQK